MKVKDEVAWQALKRDFAEDNHPLAPLLRDFTIAWAKGAESVLSINKLAVEEDEEWSPMQCLRHTMKLTESKMDAEHLTIGVVGAALVLLTMHWAYGESLFEDMTEIEQRLVEDSALLKMIQLSSQAEEEQ